MAELSADVVVSKVKRGEKIDRADLSGINLANAVLEGASFPSPGSWPAKVTFTL